MNVHYSVEVSSKRLADQPITLSCKTYAKDEISLINSLKGFDIHVSPAGWILLGREGHLEVSGREYQAVIETEEGELE